MIRKDESLVCPNLQCVKHRSEDTPFFYPESTYDSDGGETGGVLAYPDGTPSNRFEDGTVGVPAHIIKAIKASDELPHCVHCLDEAEWEPIVAVLFRKWPKSEGGDVIAIFPEIVADSRGNVDSYMHIGQHNGADLGIVYHTKAATPEEYTALKNELESYPYYYHLRVVKRVSRKMRERQINGMTNGMTHQSGRVC